MRTVLRFVQFLLVGVCLAAKLAVDIILKLYIFIIALALFAFFVLSLFGADGWKFFLSFLIAGIQIFLMTFLLEFASNWIGKTFGIFLNEKEEDSRIYERYEKQFFRRYGGNSYNSQRTGYSGYSGYGNGRAGGNTGYNRNNNNGNSSGNSGYRSYQSYSGTADNVVEKYEKYLKYFGIDKGIKITPEMIKKAYKTKIKEVHPDRNPGKDTTAETAKVNEIKEFLDMNLQYYLMKRGL